MMAYELFPVAGAVDQNRPMFAMTRRLNFIYKHSLNWASSDTTKAVNEGFQLNSSEVMICHAQSIKLRLEFGCEPGHELNVSS